ncbi:MAG TPA: biotin/lipoate A/B protein ligase family protein [Nostocaceae cyanobacterium]|nr:biotin/lipoate A/B protein ligase family protein [Nostocaceae cyanobacterium]
MQTWRFIPLFSAAGKVQMAVDHWLLTQHQLGQHPPTLRFYTWLPAAISLGYHQKQFPEYWQNIIWQGEKLDLVRRPSGGRGVLHQGDLTYSVVISGISSNRMEAYMKICEFLIYGWRSLGVELSYGTAGRGYIHNPNCFGTATGADLVTADNTKLIGSAQLRKGSTILQHGSMQLNPDVELFKQVFSLESFTPAQLPNFDFTTIIQALTSAACECFDIQLETQPLSEDEWGEILASII